MRRILGWAIIGMAALAFAAPEAAVRPKITGIDHVAFYTTAPEGVTHLYHQVLGLVDAQALEPGEAMRFQVGKQWVGYSSAPNPKSIDFMNHVAFDTNNAAALKSYLAGKGVKVPEQLETWPDGTRTFRVKDPEGHLIEFVERSASSLKEKPAPDAVSRRLIHTGFVVRDRAAEDAFYKEILGFHVYWFGGMQPGRVDWCAMQVPDGTDWLEYMLNISANPDQRTLGVMNHISLGVVKMADAQAKLESHGWTPHGSEHAQMGKDGKWQLNLYDPDLTRIELMDFRPTQKPCCSEIHGPFPGPNQ